MSEKSQRRAAARWAKKAAKQAAKKAAKQAATAAAALKPKKKTKVQLTKKEAAQIGELTEENLRKHNFKHYPRVNHGLQQPTDSSFWAKETVPLPFPIPWE